MEGVATTAYTGLKSYWRRNGYRRINDLESQPKNNRRRRFRISRPRLKLGRFRFGLGSVRKFFLRIRDAYVNAMVGLAGKGSIYGAVYSGALGGFGGGGHAAKEYDEKMLIEIYKRMVLAQRQGQLGMVANCRKLGSEVAPFSSFI